MGGKTEVVVSNSLHLFLYFLRHPDIVLVRNSYQVGSSPHTGGLEVKIESQIMGILNDLHERNFGLIFL